MGLIDWMVVELNHYNPMDYCCDVMLKDASLLELCSTHLKPEYKTKTSNIKLLFVKCHTM